MEPLGQMTRVWSWMEGAGAFRKAFRRRLRPQEWKGRPYRNEGKSILG